MAQIGNGKVQQRPEHIAEDHHRHHNEEGAVHPVGQHIIQSAAGHQRKCQVDSSNAHCAADIDGKEFFVIFKIAEKNHQRRFVLKILRGHSTASKLQ